MVKGFTLLLIIMFLIPSAGGQENLGPPDDKTEHKQPRDITGIEEVPPAPASPRWPYWASLGFIIFLALGLIGWKVYRRISRSEPPPDQWALANLSRIEDMGLPAGGQVERYHTLVSDVIRRYLQLRFHLHAPRQTTPEFLESLRQSPLLTPAQKERLRAFLERCDLAKFAGVAFSPEECGALGQTARELVEQIQSQPSIRFTKSASRPATALRSSKVFPSR